MFRTRLAAPGTGGMRHFSRCNNSVMQIASQILLPSSGTHSATNVVLNFLKQSGSWSERWFANKNPRGQLGRTSWSREAEPGPEAQHSHKAHAWNSNKLKNLPLVFFSLWSYRRCFMESLSPSHCISMQGSTRMKITAPSAAASISWLKSHQNLSLLGLPKAPDSLSPCRFQFWGAEREIKALADTREAIAAWGAFHCPGECL